MLFLLVIVTTFDESYSGNKVLALIDNVKPIVSITSPINNATVSSGTFTVTGTALDTDSGINSVQVKINSGSPITATPKSPGDWSIWTVSILF
ncbi:MAG: Ig-like domain-containing protein [Thaumarchaeota archaeon]|nr:Ig-like domain-containing protein [Nitrososphaerota archaeon]